MSTKRGADPQLLQPEMVAIDECVLPRMPVNRGPLRSTLSVPHVEPLSGHAARACLREGFARRRPAWVSVAGRRRRVGSAACRGAGELGLRRRALPLDRSADGGTAWST
ncbi:hypothetical protein BN11_4490004 [Nostocoides australiense Ben110]|uniref:Uncharacterized protein n=1 Tax=Nostocoides australiense Ben110 TaxID=1193182 RepID=W6JZ76_9MICO|nr:hypothetical protein BN11_4490004 [Tetrasphaera australiensis Ben110]